MTTQGDHSVTVRELEYRLADLRNYVDTLQKSNSRALKLAEEGLSRRLEGMNEFRQQILVERADFAKKSDVALLRVESEAEHRTIRSEGRAVAAFMLTAGVTLGAAVIKALGV